VDSWIDFDDSHGKDHAKFCQIYGVYPVEPAVELLFDRVIRSARCRTLANGLGLAFTRSPYFQSFDFANDRSIAGVMVSDATETASVVVYPAPSHLEKRNSEKWESYFSYSQVSL
jgi:hypothetical protein